jgi:hypothetical protein
MNFKIDQQLQKIKQEKDFLKKLNFIKVLKDELLPEYIKTLTTTYLKEMQK